MLGEDIPYQDALEELLHPAGLKVIYERTMDDYIPPGGETTSGETHIMPKISNYYAYKLTSDSSIAGCSGCQGGMGGTTGDSSRIEFDDYYSSISWDKSGTSITADNGGSFYYMQGPGITFGGDMHQLIDETTGVSTGWEIDGISFAMEGVTGGYGSHIHGVSLGAKPNHVYPDWTYDGLTGTQFGDFKMSQIYFLSSPGSSPNAGITSCDQSLAGCTA
jgi:hypothetical protein